jgi:uncharacterized protein YdcH (DUF465 family)
MEEEKTINLADRIEKLITGGNREVLDRIGKVVERLEDVKLELKDDIKRAENNLNQKLDAVHISLKNEIRVTGYALKDEIKDRVADHVRLAHVS